MFSSIVACLPYSIISPLIVVQFLVFCSTFVKFISSHFNCLALQAATFYFCHMKLSHTCD